jgi:asparagine N-glycosylation enzyme membrane subunit Stt3
MVFATRFTFLFSLPIALGSAIFLYYLNRPEMLSRFDVNKTVKNATLLLATLVSLVLAMLVYFPF